MNKKILCVVQARMGSQRLPGKSLKKVYKSLSLLELVLKRISASKRCDKVILATSRHENCDRLVQLGESLGTTVKRGDENNVLSRFIDVAKEYNPYAIVRVCADNPLVSHEEIDKLIDFFLSGNYDYARNNTIESGLPDGLGAEIISMDTLLKIPDLTKNPYHHEHVTSYIIENRQTYELGCLPASEELKLPWAKLDIDTQQDLDKLRMICKKLPDENAPFWSPLDIVETLKRIYPDSKMEM